MKILDPTLTPSLFRVSTTMCCFACGKYNIFLISSENDRKPEVYRSDSKFTITSICYLLGLNVPQPFNMYFPDPKR